MTKNHVLLMRSAHTKSSISVTIAEAVALNIVALRGFALTVGKMVRLTIFIKQGERERNVSIVRKSLILVTSHFRLCRSTKRMAEHSVIFDLCRNLLHT